MPESQPDSPRGPLLIAGCRSGGALSCAIAEAYRARQRENGPAGRDAMVCIQDIDFRFSDGETCVRVDAEIGGRDVFVVQALFDPLSGRSVDENYMAFLAAARTFREHGANFVTGVLPYLAYARQDKPTTRRREPTTAKLMADLSLVAGIDQLITWDPHAPQVHGFYAKTPLVALDTMPFFEHAFGRFRGREDVIVVAPDAGAIRRVHRICRRLRLHSAVAAKIRPRPEEVEITEVLGDFDGKRIALAPDDMFSSGGTIDALIGKLVEEKGIEEVYLAASHNLCSETCRSRLEKRYASGHLRGVTVTNSVPRGDPFAGRPEFEVYDLAGIFAHAIDRIHHNRSVTAA